MSKGRFEEDELSFEDCMDILVDWGDSLDQVSTERNMCVALLAKMALALGFQGGMGEDEDEPDYPLCLIDLPVGQVSWHIPRPELHLFAGLPPYPGVWDGHTPEQKYERVMHPGDLSQRVTLSSTDS